MLTADLIRIFIEVGLFVRLSVRYRIRDTSDGIFGRVLSITRTYLNKI